MKVLIKLNSILLLLLLMGACTDTATLEAPDEVEKSTLLQLVNEVRTTGCDCGRVTYPPVSPLTWNKLLEATALIHSTDMAEANKLSHIGSDGSDAGDRVTQAGYSWSTYGENIAEGYTSEEQVMKGWIASEGHCKNIMNANFTEMGVATSGSYWTQVFGAPR